MSKMIGIALALAFSGCAAGNKAVQAPTAPAPKKEEPSQAFYRIGDPGEGWKVYPNVTLPSGEHVIFLLQHKTDGKPDAAILVMSAPAVAGGPKAVAATMRTGDEKLGAVVSEVTCSKEVPPQRCSYQGVSQGPQGPINARVVFRVMGAVNETAVIVGIWPADREGAMLKTYAAVVDGLTATIKK
jgi:hypothetical protein